jgi:hypothetical protein
MAMKLKAKRLVLDEAGIRYMLDDYLHRRCWPYHTFEASQNCAPQIASVRLRPSRKDKNGNEIIVEFKP